MIKKTWTARYNWKPDLPDQRDLLFSSAPPPAKVPAQQIDLRSNCPPVVNQGQIGSCTANALAGVLGYLELQEMDAKGGPEVFDPKHYSAFSRLFIYYNERNIEGHVDADSGASLRDGVKSLLKIGACREILWKYNPDLLFTQPSDQAYNEASRHKISQYLRVANLRELKSSLSQGFPIAFGFSVYQSFESEAVAKSGEMPFPEPGEKLMGGHAVMAVGYDDSTERLIVRNSWGTEWGMNGYFTMPYAMIESKLAQDFWTVRK